MDELQGYSGSLPSMAAAAAAAIDAVPAANGSLLPILLNMLKNMSALVLMCLVMWRRILLFVRAVPSDLAETPCAGLNLNLIPAMALPNTAVIAGNPRPGLRAGRECFSVRRSCSMMPATVEKSSQGIKSTGDLPSSLSIASQVRLYVALGVSFCCSSGGARAMLASTQSVRLRQVMGIREDGSVFLSR